MENITISFLLLYSIFGFVKQKQLFRHTVNCPQVPHCAAAFPQNPFVTGSLVVRARSCGREKVSLKSVDSLR